MGCLTFLVFSAFLFLGTHAMRPGRPGRPGRPTRSEDLGFHIFEHSLIFYMDGRFNLLRDANTMLDHQKNLGRDRSEAIAAGKAAAAIFKSMYGDAADFTNLADEKYLDGSEGATNADGSLAFRAFTVDPITRWRLAIEAKDTKSKVYKNAKIESSGWQLVALKEYTSTGSVDETLFPGDVAFVGDYHIEIWRDCPARRRPLGGPWGGPFGGSFWRRDPLNRCFGPEKDSRGINTPHIDINYRTPRVIRGGSTLVIDCILQHKTWGEGTALGVIDVRPDPDDPTKLPIARGRTVNVFVDKFDDPLAIDRN